MKYKILALFSIIVSGNCHADLYNLDQTSLFSSASGDTQLSGTVSLDFAFGLPLAGNQTYNISSLALTANNSLITFTGNNYTFFPAPIWGYSVQLDSKNSISFLSNVYLGITQTDLGTNYYQYQEEILEPVATSNPAYNHVVLGNDFLPSSLLLTYELHDVVETANLATYPAGEIGPAWQISTISDTNIGTLTISAEVASVPIPSALWLFTSSVFGLIFMQKRKLA